MGLHGKIGGVLHLPSFTGLPGFPNTGVEFSPAVGVQGGGGLEVGMEASRTWTFVGGLGVMHTTSTIHANEATTLSIDGDVIPATIQHAIELRYTAIEASLSALFATSSARICVGFIARVALQPTVLQSQQILDPPGIQFPTSTDTSGVLPGSATVVPVMVLGVEAFGTTVGAFKLEPTVRLEIPLASMSSSASWTMIGLGLGIRIRTTTTNAAQQLDTVPPLPPPFVPPVPPPPTYTQRMVRDTATTMAVYGVAPSVTLQTSTTDTLGTEITVREQYVRTIAPPPPVVTVSVRTTIVKNNPVVVRFDPLVESDVDVTSWKVEITLPHAPMESIQGVGAVPAHIEYQIKSSLAPSKKHRLVCTYRLIVQTADGSTTATSPGEIVLTGR